MKYLKSKWTALTAVLIAIGVFAAFSFGRNDTPKYFTAKVERGDIHDVVEATGTINAVKTVQVGSQISGTIANMYADFNSPVKRGQVIAQIDPSLLEGALLQAKADLQNSDANAATAEANVVKAQASAEQTQQDYNRTVALAKEGVFSQQQLDLAKANNDAAQAAVNAAKATLAQAKAQVKQKAAAVQVAQTNIDHTIITAPIDGVVVARNVDVGQTVAASLQAPVLFNIAQDLKKMQVDVSTDEADVGNIKVGQQVTFKVDAFPKETFKGSVVQVRMNPTTVQNVVTYDTVVQFENADLKLFPGMTAYVSIPVASATDVVKVPNGALRFKPQQQVAGNTAKGAGMAAGGRKPGGAGAQQANTATVWKVTNDHQLVPVQIATGITDHTFTQVQRIADGELQPGDALAIGSNTGAAKPNSAAGAPGMGGPRVGR